MVGVTGVEPVTLRLSSACSNQLSYTPNSKCRVKSVERRVNLHSAFCILHLFGGAEEIRTPDL